MLHQISSKTLMSMAISSACGFLAFSVQAQEHLATANNGSVVTDSPTPEKVDKGKIQEVMVTATRHSTSLLKTPVAITTVSQDELSRDGITDVRGLSGQVPNLQMGTANDGSSGVQIAIRGVTSTDFTEIGNPAVGLHVGGIYTPRPQAALALLFDLDQLEILRGPQGTLFGRNSTAGSINILPAKPVFGSTEGSFDAGIGNYHEHTISAVQNIPISDSWALRATAMSVRRDGYLNQQQDYYSANFPALGYTPALSANGHPIPNVDQRFNSHVNPGNYYTNQDEYALRLQSLLKVNKDLQWRLTYEKFQNNGAGDVALKDCASAAGTPYACPGGTAGQWNVNINVPGKINMKIDTLRSSLLWDVNPKATVEYNASFSRMKRREIQDSDSGYQPIESDLALKPGTSPFNDIATFTTGSQYDSMVQELQVRGKIDTLRYVGGLFWMHEKNSIKYGQDYLGVWWGTYGYPADAYYYNQVDRESDSKAAFAQIDWEFRPTWNLTVGGRLTRDKRSDNNGQYWDTGFSNDPAIYFKGAFNPGVPGPGFMPYNSSHLLPGQGSYYGAVGFDPSIQPVISKDSGSWSKFTYRLGLTHQIDPNNMVYSSLSTGYKAGGFSDKQDICRYGLNDTCAGSAPGPHYTDMSFKPETLTNLEFGYKGKLLDDHLTFSATAFFSQYSNMQLTGGVNVGKVVPKVPCQANNISCGDIVLYGTQNAAKANISGLELEGQYKPWSGTKIGYSYAYLRALVASYPTYSEDGSIPCDIRAANHAPACTEYSGSDPLYAGKFPLNIVGNHLPYTPTNSFGVNISQDIMLGEYRLTPWISYRWQEKMYFTVRNLNNPHIGDAQKAYSTTDANIRLTSPNENWYLEAYAKNLTQTVAKNYEGVIDPGYITASYNDPRFYGIRFGMKW